MKLKKWVCVLLAVFLLAGLFCMPALAAADDVADAVEQTWGDASEQIKTVVDSVVFPALGMVLAIGLVVDDSIVVVEAAQVNIAAGMRPRAAALEAMKNVASPIVATTVVLLAVFIPVSFTGGITGRLFQQFSVTIAVSVVISAFNALTLSPADIQADIVRTDEAQKWLEGKAPKKIIVVPGKIINIVI